MPQSATSVFIDPDDFAAALVHEGIRDLIITGCGRFRARLTWVALPSLRLLAGEERLSRAAFVAVPDDMVLVVLRGGTHRAPIWDGLVLQASEIMTLGPGSCAQMRTDGDCRWSAILAPVCDLTRSGREVVGDTFSIPTGMRRWHPPRATRQHLQSLHAATIHAVEFRQGELIGPDAAHGLDQQIIVELIECLCSGDDSRKPGASSAP